MQTFLEYVEFLKRVKLGKKYRGNVSIVFRAFLLEYWIMMLVLSVGLICR